MAALDFKKIFDDYIAANQKTWAHDRSKTLGGSETFGCIRKAWYSRNGTPKDTDYKESWGALERGNIIENNFVVPAMEHAQAQGLFEFLLGGENQKTFFDKNVMVPVYDEFGEQSGEAPGGLSVTPDGLITGVTRDALAKYGIADIESDCFCFEIKSIDPRVDLAEEKAIHHGQTQIQMGLIRENTAFQPNYAVICYINASFLDDIEIFVVKFDEAKFQIAKDRAVTVFETEDPTLLTREGRIDGTCQYCPFQSACIQTTKAGMPAKAKNPSNIPPDMRPRLEAILVEKRDAKLAENKAIKRRETADEDLKSLLREFNITNPKDPNAGWSVSYSMAGGRKTLDKDALAADGIDVSQYEKQGNPYEILRVTWKDAVFDE